MEGSDTLITLDVSKLCRICLLEKNLPISLYTDEYSTLRTIENCFNIKFSLDDAMPSSMCEDCFCRLNIAFQFKRECNESEEQLRSLLKNQSEFSDKTQEISTSDFIKTESRDKNNEYNFFLEKKIEMCDVLAGEQFMNDETSTLVSDFSSMTSCSDAITDGNEGSTETLEKKNFIKIKKSSKSKQSKALRKSLKVLKNKADLKEFVHNSEIIHTVDKLTENVGKKAFKRDKLKVPEQCQDCGKLFTYPGYLQTHMRIHTGEKPFECDVCKLRFTQATNLTLHMRVHSGEKPFQCEICSKRCSSSSNLKAHQRTHSEKRDFVCNQCERTFKSSLQLSNHLQTHSGIKNFHCENCDKGFYKKAYLNVHIRTAHNGEKRHSCSECGKVFANTSNLICHFRIHTGEKPFVCDICSARFNQSSALARHKKLHIPKQIYTEADESIMIDSIDQISDIERSPLIVSDEFLSPSMHSFQSDVELNVDDSQQLSITNDSQPLLLESRLTEASEFFGHGIVQMDYDRENEHMHDTTISNYMKLEENVCNLDLNRPIPDYSRGMSGHSTIYGFGL